METSRIGKNTPAIIKILKGKKLLSAKDFPNSKWIISYEYAKPPITNGAAINADIFSADSTSDVHNSVLFSLYFFAITGTTDVEKCYGIPTAKFMELAVELDPSTRSKVEAEEADAE